MMMNRVLLVDDDRDCLLALGQRLRFTFRHLELEVDTAACATTALLLAHAYHYDALIVDVMMPGVTRFKFLEQLGRIQPGVPIIVMSGFDMQYCEAEVRRLGLTAFLPKPLDFSKLSRGLAAVLPDKSVQARHRQAQWLARRSMPRLTHKPRFGRTNHGEP
jgi:DNA-binding NtrC family response regulator